MEVLAVTLALLLLVDAIVVLSSSLWIKLPTLPMLCPLTFLTSLLSPPPTLALFTFMGPPPLDEWKLPGIGKFLIEGKLLLLLRSCVWVVGVEVRGNCCDKGDFIIPLTALLLLVNEVDLG